MKKIPIALSLASLVFTGCMTAVSSARQAGHMNEAGNIQSCVPNRRDAQSCGNAIFNATVIAGIHKGQSRGDVRGIMRHDAERREFHGSTESWGYITNYKDQMVTWITFTDYQVSSLSHEALTPRGADAQAN